jgi:hypothetical protein
MACVLFVLVWTCPPPTYNFYEALMRLRIALTWVQLRCLGIGWVFGTRVVYHSREDGLGQTSHRVLMCGLSILGLFEGQVFWRPETRCCIQLELLQGFVVQAEFGGDAVQNGALHDPGGDFDADFA